MTAMSAAGELLPTRKLAGQLGSAVEIKTSVERFAALTAKRDLLKTMGEKGAQAWEDLPSWEEIAAEYEKLFKQLM